MYVRMYVSMQYVCTYNLHRCHVTICTHVLPMCHRKFVLIFQDNKQFKIQGMILLYIPFTNNKTSHLNQYNYVYVYVLRMTVYVLQWNLCNTMGPTRSVLMIKVSWFSRSAYVLKNYFGTSTKHVDYAGVLISKCPY